MTAILAKAGHAAEATCNNEAWAIAAILAAFFALLAFTVWCLR